MDGEDQEGGPYPENDRRGANEEFEWSERSGKAKTGTREGRGDCEEIGDGEDIEDVVVGEEPESVDMVAEETEGVRQWLELSDLAEFWKI